MAQYETKLIIKLMAELVVKSKSVKAAYSAIADNARDEGIHLPSYEEKIKEIDEREKN